jgi:tetratricopeptide (TPR) repeat protein
MQIVYVKGDFLFTIFPELANSEDIKIISVLENYYTYNSIKPSVRIEASLVIVDIDTPKIISQESDFSKVVSLCEKGNYGDAKPILNKLIKDNPTNSEYHRIMGQILSDEGDQNEAINCLIDALRWDSKNNWALLMMGNIFAKFKNDIPTAMKYYDHAVLANPNDFTSIYNIGAILYKEGKYEEAKKYLWESLKINNTYPNTHHVLALIAKSENDLHSAFYNVIQTLILSKQINILYENSMKLAFELTKQIISTEDGKNIYRTFRKKLELEGGTEIDIFKDNTIQTPAKIEFAEVYNREKHTVRFKPDYPAVEHLIMHELVHLKFVIEARKEGLNMLFTSKSEQKTKFLKSIELTIQKLKKMNVGESEITNYCNGLFSGINLQVYNAPIDLFIENYLYNEYAELRPFQFFSIYNLLQEALRTVTDRNIAELSPNDILSKNKIYNLVNAFQFRDLYGIDLITEFKPTKVELKQAKLFYDEFLEYKDDKQPAEEYELVQHWADDLNLNPYFTLISEIEYNKNKKTESSLLSFFERLSTVKSETPADNETEMQHFLEKQKENGTNIDVVMFMVEALEYFESLSKDKIKEIAYEIAYKGTQGYDPNKIDYTIDLIPNKNFSGFQILAYYYVSFALGAPEILMEVGLPYHEEYLLAKTMKNRSN